MLQRVVSYKFTDVSGTVTALTVIALIIKVVVGTSEKSVLQSIISKTAIFMLAEVRTSPVQILIKIIYLYAPR
jgi:hypothetical protein